MHEIERKTVFQLLVEYIKVSWRFLLSHTVLVLIFFLVFYFYNLPLEPILYALSLYLAFALVFFVFVFTRFYRRYSMIYDCYKQARFDPKKLPEPQSLTESLYHDMLISTEIEKQSFVSKSEIKQKDAIDYYTMWVHQIKTPIAAMHLMLQTDKDIKKNALLSSELFKIEQYVEMVLSYLRLDSESTDYVFQRYNLDLIIKKAVKKYSKLFILKNIRLDFKESGTNVLTDEKWLSFVIEQILANSLKYTSKGSISIYTKGNTLFMKDSGIGIAPEDLPRIFEKGYTGFNGRMDKKSTGIGLYLCKRILGKLSHKIKVDSEVGKGTVVMITFLEAELRSLE